MRISLAIVLGLLLSLSIGCKQPKRSSDNQGIRYGAEEKDLIAHMSDLRAATKAGDTKSASSLTMLLLPDDDDLHLALRKNTDSAFKKIAELHRRFMPKNDYAAATMFGDRPEQSVIQVHGLSTERLASRTRNTDAHREFPKVIAKLARTILRPKTIFYEVEFLEPGQTLGTKYHLFFHNGKNWKMLGPIWRAL